MHSEFFSVAYRTARKIAVGMIGATVVAIGLALLVLPGPAFLVIPAGLAILALEFTWARRWLRVLRERSKAVINSFGKPKADLKK